MSKKRSVKHPKMALVTLFGERQEVTCKEVKLEVRIGEEWQQRTAYELSGRGELHCFLPPSSGGFILTRRGCAGWEPTDLLWRFNKLHRVED